LTTHYYLGLYAINLKSKQSRTIWEKKDDNKETIMAHAEQVITVFIEAISTEKVE